LKQEVFCIGRIEALRRSLTTVRAPQFARRRALAGHSGESLMRKTVLGLFALLSVLGSAGHSHAQQSVKVGVLLPYSVAGLADLSTQVDNGIKLYMKEHGDMLVGKKIEILRKDDGGMAPDIAKRLAQELIVRDGVDILAGFMTTPNTMAVSDVSASAKKFMVIMNATASLATTKSPYSARVTFTNPTVSELLGTWAYKNGIRRLYSMVADYSPGHDAEDGVLRTYKAAGGEPVGTARLPVSNPDFSAYVQRVKDQNPDGIFVWVSGVQAQPAIIKALAERGIDAKNSKLLGQGELVDEVALKNTGDDAIGIITAAHYDYSLPTKKNQDFVKAYVAAYNRNPTFFALHGYDGMHLIYEALKKTNGKTDGDSLIEAAKGMSWESPRGNMTIDPETRDVIQTFYIRKVAKIDGVLKNVEIDRFENVKDPVKARAK
jgi:branched-chain amino acid transport system substrate-binding protein